MSELKKCIVWDLDNTLWDGVCLEGEVSLRGEVVGAIRELDRRGILHSIASRGDEELALKVLRDHEIDGLFLVPRIGWLPKSQSIVQISRELGISTDSMAFVDDDPFEREQIEFMLPGVLTIDARNSPLIPAMPEFSPGSLTPEAAGRRRFYQSEVSRQAAAAAFSTREEFLKSCGMTLSVRAMKAENIPRVAELMSRTHQLNTTGWLIGTDELAGILRREGDSAMITVAELEDRFGSYGIIGAAIVETLPPAWRLKYLAVSCRVLGRGVERAFLVSLLREARARGFAPVEATFRDTGKNRMMRALYQMVGLRPAGECAADGALVFTLSASDLPEIPPWVSVK